jgi:hypothetical protein
MTFELSENPMIPLDISFCSIVIIENPYKTIG